MKLSLAIALVRLIAAVMGLLERQRWYQEGKAAADAEANAEQQRRIEKANAARAGDDQFAGDGGLHDPRRRD